jgi:hypothetical protein
VVVVRTEPARPADGTVAPGGTVAPDPVVAPDPMTRFPFLVTDPEAATVRRPDAVVPTGLEPEVASVAPGPELAALLTAVDPAQVTDRGLVELVDGAVRQAAWAHAAAARYAGLLGARDSMNPSWSLRAGVPKVDDVTGDELALRLAWSRRAAARLVRHGRAFDRDLAATGTALARGELDAVRAGVVADRLHGLPIPVTLDVQDVVLARAARRTASQLVADVERALIAVDPGEAAARRRHARTGRRVDRPKVLPDGMAGLWAVLPADDATRVHRTLDAAARTARAAGDGRTLDQLRADGLTDLVLHRACPAGDAVPTARRDAASDAPTDATDAGPAAGLDARSAGCPVKRRSTDAQIVVTVPLSTLMGLDEQPAELAGYGPVDATTARALAAGGVWRRLVTDPLSGTVLDLGRTRYRPTAALAEHVRARDRTCVRPGCSAPAESCDLDHTVEFQPPGGADPAAGGRTSADNLGPLCRRDHRLKTDGGFALRQVAPGRFEWITPTGQRYLVEPGIDRDPVPAGRDVGPPDGLDPPF